MPRSAGLLRWTGLLLAVVLVAACTSSDDDDLPTSVSVIPEASTLLRVASETWPDCLNPLTCDDETARTLVFQHVLPKLMEVDALGGYVPSPVLAAEPEVRVDRVTGEQSIVFVIAEDARWHDGRPITSSDVTGTWLAHVNTPGADTRGYSLITAVDDRDPLRARVVLSRPYADWPELFGGHDGWLLQADAFDGDTDLTGQFQDFLPFGAASYELVSFEERALVLVAREEHWATDRMAAIDQVRIEHDPGISATDARVSDELVRPGIDVVIPARAVEAVPDRFELRRAPTTEVVGLLLDRRTAPLGSQGVREAIDEAIDRRELLELVDLSPPALVTCLGGLPQSPACDDADLLESRASVPDAEALLDADGWPRDPDDPSGPRGRPGLALATPVTFDRDLPGASARRWAPSGSPPRSFPPTWRRGPVPTGARARAWASSPCHSAPRAASPASTAAAPAWPTPWPGARRRTSSWRPSWSPPLTSTAGPSCRPSWATSPPRSSPGCPSTSAPARGSSTPAASHPRSRPRSARVPSAP